MAQTGKGPPETKRTPLKPPSRTPAKVSQPFAENVAEPMPESPGQLGIINRGLDEIDNCIDRITNLTKNISTRLYGSLAETPAQRPDLPEGELYTIPIRLSVIQEGLREIEILLDDAYNKL